MTPWFGGTSIVVLVHLQFTHLYSIIQTKTMFHQKYIKKIEAQVNVRVQ